MESSHERRSLALRLRVASSRARNALGACISAGDARRIPHLSQAALGFFLALAVGAVPSAVSRGSAATDVPQGRATILTLPGRETLATYTQNAWAHVECSPVLAGNYDQLKCQIGTLEVVKADRPDATAEPGLSASDRAEIARAELDTRSSRANEELAKLKAGTIKATPEHQAYWTDLAALGEEMKSALDNSAVKAAWSRMREIEKNTCRLAFAAQELTFSRTAENHWVSNPGPQGSCHEVVVHALEMGRSQQTPAPSWTYSRRSVSAELGRFPWCRAIKLRINQPEVYGAALNHGIAAGCKYLTVDTVW
jgi:hypothetical protein